MRNWSDTRLNGLIEEVMRSEQCLDRGVFDADALRRGRLGSEDRITVLNVELWFRLFIDQDSDWLSRVRPLHRLPELTQPTA